MAQTMSDISFRPVNDSDIDFLKQVYFSTRLDEVGLTGWNEQQIDDFLSHQFQAQHQFYMEQFPAAEFTLILFKNIPAGRFYVETRNDEIRVIDIALLPDYRQQGIGKKIMQQTLDKAKTQNLPVHIHVEKNNPAMHLYQRLGFTEIEDKGVYLFLRWSPEQ